MSKGLSKRQEIHARRRKRQIFERVLIFILVAASAIIVVYTFVLPSYMSAGNDSNQETSTGIGPIVTIVPRNYAAPVNGASIGYPNASVRVEVWEDFLCPGCLYYTEQIEPQIMINYVETSKVLYTFRFYPIPSHGIEASQSANAAMCAVEQNRFWDYHDTLFTNYNEGNIRAFSNSGLVTIAETLELEMDTFNQCFTENRYSEQINQDFQEGQALGVHSTPSILVDRQIVLSSVDPNYIPSYENIVNAIETALTNK